MTIFLFGNSNRRHIADPNRPHVTLCGIVNYQTVERVTHWLDPVAQAEQRQRLMALPLCTNCHKAQP